MTVTTDEPSPPRPPQTRSEGARLIGGLIVTCVGLVVVATVAVIAMLLVKKTTSDVVAIATATFGVVGTVVGAYFGVKIGSDGTVGLPRPGARILEVAPRLRRVRTLARALLALVLV